MSDLNHLYGSCACERNQYTVVIPSSSTSLAQVFFDNSASNRRSQATPVTAWLRIPLDWYHSTTFAQFPDETHHSIRRTFNAITQHPALPPTRRQFCGYCGTHLTAWNEGLDDSGDFLNVTLGSLLSESIDRLEALNIIPDNAEDEIGLVQRDEVDEEGPEETHEDHMGGVEGPATTAISQPTSEQLSTLPPRYMQNRGMPYFEEMVENSRLGRIKRQKGGHTSRDGRTTVQWEVVEIGGNDSSPVEAGDDTGGSRHSHKRQKTDS